MASRPSSGANQRIGSWVHRNGVDPGTGETAGWRRGAAMFPHRTRSVAEGAIPPGHVV